MTLETQAAFARRIGVDKSQITRWKQEGRVVMDGARVDVEASLERIESTRGTRNDVSDRHAAERGHALALDLELAEPAQETPDATPDAKADLNLDEVGRRTRVAQMQKEEHAAALKALERAEREGAVVPRSDVERVATDACSVVLSAVEGIEDRLAPLLVGADLQRIRALLREESENLLATVSAELGRMGGKV